MIFVSTGTQLPFPRLIDGIAALAPKLDTHILAQTGPQDVAQRPGIECRSTLTPTEFSDAVQAASVIIGHAGIGTVLSCKAARKPLILVPRRFALGEHRNDHQVATAKHLAHVTGIYIAWEVEEIEHLLADAPLDPATPEPGPQLDQLVMRIAAFING